MGDITRERILDAATALVRSLGTDAVTMDTTADAAGVSRKTVYNYFPHKFALIDSVVARGVERVIADLKVTASDPELDFISKLNKITASGFEQIKNGKKMFIGPEHPREEPVLPDVYREIRKNLLGFIGGIVHDAAVEGLIRSDIPIRKLTYVLINMIEGLIFNEDLEDEPFTRLDILKESLKSMLFGIMTPLGMEAMRDSPIFIEETEVGFGEKNGG